MCNLYNIVKGGMIIKEEIINGKLFRLVTLRGRGKWIAADGDAYNPTKCKQKASIHINRDGYPCFGGGVPVHLYVANAWVDGRFDGAEVDHIDFDRSNYRSENLRWVSHQDNVRHSVVDVNHYKGKRCGNRNGRALLTDEDVECIRALYADGLSTMDVVKVLHPNYTFMERKSVWNRYDRIKKQETWR